MRIQQLPPHEVYARYVIIDILNTVPISLLKRIIETNKIPGDFFEEIYEDDATEPTTVLNYKWLLFTATTFQMESVAKNLVAVPKKKKQEDTIPVDIEKEKQLVEIAQSHTTEL